MIERQPYVPPTTEPTSTHSRRWQDVMRFADLLLRAAEPRAVVLHQPAH